MRAGLLAGLLVDVELEHVTDDVNLHEELELVGMLEWELASESVWDLGFFSGWQDTTVIEAELVVGRFV